MTLLNQGERRFRVVSIGTDGLVQSSFGELTDRDFAKRVAYYAQQKYPDAFIELQERVLPSPPPPWRTVMTYEPSGEIH